ncbi:hypothetical protein AAMO2058_001249500 [Amorphochlora amoebiformis]
MVTVEYIGYFQNDPYNGTTRVFCNNVGGNGGGINCSSGTTSYTIGSQRPGGKFISYNDVNFYGSSMLDWGAFTVKENATSDGLYGIFALSGTDSRGYSMSRALGSTEDMVSEPERRVMYGWLSHDNALHTRTHISSNNTLSNPSSFVGLRAEIKVLGCGDGSFTKIGVDMRLGLAILDGTLQGKDSVRAGRAGPLVFSYERPQLKPVELADQELDLAGVLEEIIVAIFNLKICELAGQVEVLMHCRSFELISNLGPEVGWIVLSML